MYLNSSSSKSKFVYMCVSDQDKNKNIKNYEKYKRSFCCIFSYILLLNKVQKKIFLVFFFDHKVIILIM